jgi:pimeloyl-ACP methyl ester carboxylesterase
MPTRWASLPVIVLACSARGAATAVLDSRVVELPGRGLRMEYTSARPAAAAALGAPPLVFIHGTFHGSWCFAEHWLEHFAQRGYEAYALSLRGTRASPEPLAPRRVRVAEHVADVGCWLRTVLGEDVPVVLVGHSFGGAYVQKLLEQGDAQVAGAVLLCSVPPSGNGAMIWRFLRRTPLGALRITRGFALKSACRSVGDASALFFSDALPETEVRRYMERFGEDSACGLDVPDFNRQLPARGSSGSSPPEWARQCPPVLVLGAERDAVVDEQALRETASFYSAQQPTVMPGLGHDVMLVPGWEQAADAICEWLPTITSGGVGPAA